MSKKASYVKTYLILFAAVALLTGCGGGGGSSTTTPSYTVSATAGTGGSISPASVIVNEGATASFTVTPNTGYSIDSVTGCGGTLSGNTYTTGAVTADCTVTANFVLNSYTVSWDTNRESGVNSTGGGYRVYHSTTAGFDIGSADVVDVPHVSGTTPTSTTLTLSTGTHYIKVVAYSALNPTGSTPSSQIAVTAP